MQNCSQYDFLFYDINFIQSQVKFTKHEQEVSGEWWIRIAVVV